MSRFSLTPPQVDEVLESPSSGIPVQISPEALDEIRSLTYRLSGIVLNEAKAGLVVTRLRNRLRALRMHSFEEYVAYLSEDGHPEEFGHFIDALSTNVTSFFREPRHFEFLRDALTRLRDAGQAKVRIWSAACSTGQEPYSMGMVAHEVYGGAETRSASVDLRILATDISGSALDQARAAQYDHEDLEPIPERLRARYSRAHPAAGTAEIVTEVKDLVTFARINLAQSPYPMHGPLDIIFCRNVMIYFDQTVRSVFLNEAHRLLSPEGYLVVASSESTVPSPGLFRSVAPAIFQRIQE